MTGSRTPAPLLPIGELSRTSGLTVSALRFYDREGLLVPAEVDPQTGYRRYSPAQVRSARLLAGMRRVGMPLAEMAAALSALPDQAMVEDLLAAHLRRLESGLADARREVDRLRHLLPGPASEPWTATVPAQELAQAVQAVRYAVGDDPDFPMLCGVLVEPLAGSVRLVATDRYRLALADAGATLTEPVPGGAALLPTSVVDQVRRLLSEDPGGQVVLALTPATYAITLPGGRRLTGDCLDLDFPDYRQLLATPQRAGAAARLPVADILAALATQREEGADDPVWLHPDGVGARSDGAGSGSGGVLVDRTFLWEAAQALGDGHAVLPLEDPGGPLTFHGPDDVLRGLLMPVRPEPGR